MASKKRRLDLSDWHKTPISIIITHHNYSSFIEDAILSIVDQTYENWECIVVDDHSDTGEVKKVERIVKSIGDQRVSLICLDQNIGQIPAFYTGFDQCSGEFICLLDPDDRYATTFLERSLAAHLNTTVICPISSTDQFLTRRNFVISSNVCGHYALSNQDNKIIKTKKSNNEMVFIPSSKGGWHWSSTSSLMIRRSAIELLKPHKNLTYNKCADGYLAQGAHALGGTLFIAEPLVYRCLHEKNSWMTDSVYSSFQNTKRVDAVQMAPQAKIDAIEAIRANGGPELEINSKFDKVIQTAAEPLRRQSIAKKSLRYIHRLLSF